MGRQHTIYLSDETWEHMEALRRQGDTMSQVIRTAVKTAFLNLDNYDLTSYQGKVIEALQKRIDHYEFGMCKKCARELVL